MHLKNKILRPTLAVMGLFFAGCAGQGGSSYTPVSVGYNNGNGINNLPEIVHLTPSEPASLDFHIGMDIVSAELTRQLFEQLVVFDDNGNIVPHLAESFEMIDELTWEFRIRQGVYFHDGTPLNADAVRINVERILDPNFASPRVFIMDMIERVEVVDNYTVRKITYFPFVPLPNNIVHSGSLISPAAIELERNGGPTVAENPVGTGPFRFYSRIHGEEIRLVSNENYWRGAPDVNLTVRIIPDNATRMALLETGQAHTMRLVTSDAVYLQQDPNIDVHVIDSTQLIFLGFNHNVTPFDDIRVRQAITMAINKDDILYGILDGFGTIAHGPVSPVVFGGEAVLDTLPLDVEAARQLMIDAGFEDGFDTSILVAEGNLINAMIAEYIQASLAQIGIRVSIESLIWASFLEHTAAGNHQMFINGWSTTTGDADYAIHALFHSSVPAGSGNRSFYANPELDYLLDIGRASPDMDFRRELYATAQQLLVDDAAKVFLYFPAIPFAKNGVGNVWLDFSAIPHFWDAYFK